MRRRPTVFVQKATIRALATYWGCSFPAAARMTRTQTGAGRLAFTRPIQKS